MSVTNTHAAKNTCGDSRFKFQGIAPSMDQQYQIGC